MSENGHNNVTISEASAILDKPYYTIHRLIRKEKLKAEKIGWIWLVDKASVLALKKAEEKKARR